MNIKGWTSIVGVAVLTAGWLVSGQLWAQTKLSDGYTLEDFNLTTAANLVDICTLEQSHLDHMAARAFCYGFFEGGIHYDEALSGSPTHKKIVCDPPGTTARMLSRSLCLMFRPIPGMLREHRSIQSSVL